VIVDTPTSPVAAVTHPDPYPYYADLVTRRPLYRDQGLGLWVAASAAAVTAVLTSEACRVRPPAEPVPGVLVGTAAGDLFRRLVRMNDGADHVRLKPSVAATLAMLAAPSLGPHATEAAAALDAARLTDFAFRLAPEVLGRLLGMPPEQRAEAAVHTEALVRGLAPSASPVDVERGAAAAAALLAIVRALPRFATAGDDLVANVVGFFSQAYEATAGLVGNTLVALGRQPEVLRRVRQQPSTMPAVVTEVARHDAPVQNTRRFVAEPVDVAGQTLPAGAVVLVVLAAANRDPAANADPDRFDAARRERRAFTFGLGPHACPGEAVAVAVASAGVGRLLAAGVEPGALAFAYRPSANTRVPLFA
jgi:cytochrome P450